jgi:hypothetical protein
MIGGDNYSATSDFMIGGDNYSATSDFMIGGNNYSATSDYAVRKNHIALDMIAENSYSESEEESEYKLNDIFNKNNDNYISGGSKSSKKSSKKSSGKKPMNEYFALATELRKYIAKALNVPNGKEVVKKVTVILKHIISQNIKEGKDKYDSKTLEKAKQYFDNNKQKFQ